MKKGDMIVVLNDGETYTSLKGCEILLLSEGGFEHLEDGRDPNDLEAEDIISRIDISELVDIALSGK